MPGGRFDSSKTRVAPVFGALLAQDSTGRAWLPTLLGLPRHGAHEFDRKDVGSIVRTGWEPREVPLDPPLSLLSWLIRNAKSPASTETDENERKRLLNRDPSAIRAALGAIRTSREARAWYIFEGPSFADVFIETEQAVIVIEGKRTERGPTTSTTWMPGRHQMLRHLDCALEIVGSRHLFGFFVVEGDAKGDLPRAWQEACCATLSNDAVEGSLPHRPETERSRIRSAFLGATTWQQVCAATGIDFASLPNEVKAPPSAPSS